MGSQSEPEAIPAEQTIEAGSLPLMGDRCHALATYIGDSVDNEIVAMLESRLQGSGAAVLGDKAVHEARLKGHLVWRRSWGELLDTAYMPRVAFSLRQAEPPESPVLTVVMDGVTVYEGVPDWVARNLRGEPLVDADREAFFVRLLAAIQGSLDRPVAYLEAQPEPAASGGPPSWTRVLVVAEDQTTLDGLSRLLAEDPSIQVVCATTDPWSAVEEFHALGAGVVLVDLNLSSNAGVWLTERLSAEAPNANVILVAEDEASASVRRAHLAGARHVLVWPFSAETLVGAVRSAIAVSPGSPPSLRIAEEPDHVETEPEEETATQAPEPAEPAPAARGEVIAVFSLKGGVGKSLIAANLAGALASQSGGSIALLDLDLRFGDLSGLLGLERGTSVARYLATANPPTPAELDRLSQDGPQGIRLLLGSVTPEEAERLTVDHIRQAIGSLRGLYSHVVVDCSAQAGRQTMAAVTAADRVILVTDVDPATIRNARLALGMLSSLNVAADRVAIVLNRTSPDDPLTPEDVERMIGRDVTLQLPRDHAAVQQSVFQASLLVSLNPDSSVSRALKELALALLTAAA